MSAAETRDFNAAHRASARRGLAFMRAVCAYERATQRPPTAPIARARNGCEGRRRPRGRRTARSPGGKRSDPDEPEPVRPAADRLKRTKAAP
jgi:hypothetical protein